MDKIMADDGMREEIEAMITSGILDLGRLQELIDQGIDINQRVKGLDNVTLLHIAALNGDLPTVKLLIEKGGANVNCIDRDGWTPLHGAARFNHCEAVKLLMDKGAGVDIPCDVGNAPLHWACWGGHLDVVELLIERGNASINSINSNDETPLWEASYKGYFKIVEYLLENGADCFIQDENGYAPLMIAEERGHSRVANLLKKHNPEMAKHLEKKHPLDQRFKELEKKQQLYFDARVAQIKELLGETLSIQSSLTKKQEESMDKIQSVIKQQKMILIALCSVAALIFIYLSTILAVLDSLAEKQHNKENRPGHKQQFAFLAMGIVITVLLFPHLYCRTQVGKGDLQIGGYRYIIADSIKSGRLQKKENQSMVVSNK